MKENLGKGFASLFGLHILIRFLHGCCAVVVLSLFSYFLATLGRHSMPVGTWVRAIEGISGSAVLYSFIAGGLLCCVPGRSVPSFLTMVFDVLFAAAFVYVAVANRFGAGSCSGEVDTVFGRGDAETNVRSDNSPGANEDPESLPSLRQACEMEKACLIAASAAIVLFVLSPFISVATVRRRKKVKRRNKLQADGVGDGHGRRKGFLSLFGFGHKGSSEMPDQNQLPMHPEPSSISRSGTLVESSDQLGGRGGSMSGNEYPDPGNPYAQEIQPQENPYARWGREYGSPRKYWTRA